MADSDADDDERQGHAAEPVLAAKEAEQRDHSQRECYRQRERPQGRRFEKAPPDELGLLCYDLRVHGMLDLRCR